MHYENGFDHMKIKLGFGVQDDINVMKSIHKVLSIKIVLLWLIPIMPMELQKL